MFWASSRDYGDPRSLDHRFLFPSSRIAGLVTNRPSVTSRDRIWTCVTCESYSPTFEGPLAGIIENSGINPCAQHGPRLKSVVGPLWVADLLDLTGFENPTQLERQFASGYRRPRVASLTAFPWTFAKLEKGQRLPSPNGLVRALSYKHRALVRLFGTVLLAALSSRAPIQDRRWYAGIKEVLGVLSFESDHFGYRGRAVVPQGRSWVVSHCERRGDTAGLGMLLHMLNDAQVRPKANGPWITKVTAAARNLSIRLAAFPPFYDARYAFCEYLEHYFFRVCCPDSPLTRPKIDTETARIRAAIVALAERGLISNDFSMQSRLALWLARMSSESLESELAQLTNRSLAEISPGTALYRLLKHTRCWMTRDNKPIATHFRRKIKEEPRIANALDASFKPYADEIEHLRVLPTEEQMSARVRLRKLQLDWRRRPPGDPSYELAMRAGLSFGIARTAGYRSREEFRLSPPRNPRAPPNAQHEQGVQR